MTLDRITARALVEAGYMPLPEYIEMFGEEILAGTFHQSPNVVPDIHGTHDQPASQGSKDPSVV